MKLEEIFELAQKTRKNILYAAYKAGASSAHMEAHIYCRHNCSFIRGNC